MARLTRSTTEGARKVAIAGNHSPVLRQLRERLNVSGAGAVSIIPGPPALWDRERYQGVAVALFGLFHLLSFGRRRAADLEAIRQQTRILLVLDRSELGSALRVLDCCDGIAFAGDLMARFRDVVDLALHGYCVMPQEVFASLIRRHIRVDFLTRLTERERTVLTLLGGGLADRAIAERLEISDSAVKNHVRNVLRKMHFRNRTEAGVFAMFQNLDAEDSGIIWGFCENG